MHSKTRGVDFGSRPAAIGGELFSTLSLQNVPLRTCRSLRPNQSSGPNQKISVAERGEPHSDWDKTDKPSDAMSKEQMTESEIRVLWDELQETLGRKVLGVPLKQEQWTFRFSRAKTQLGVTQHRDKYITVSRVLAQNGLSRDAISDTIRHEIAHAIDYEMRGETGHGPKWKALAKKCGANPERTTDLPEEVSPPYRWHRWCPSCEIVVGKYYRRPTSDKYVCKSCRGELDIVKAPTHPDVRSENSRSELSKE